jgi:hypothetical protein
MKITTDELGWTTIEAAGLTIIVPTTDDAMADDRAEIRCNGSRIWVESHDDGPLVSPVESYSESTP